MTIASNLSFIENSAGAVTTGTFNVIGLPYTFSANGTEYFRLDVGGNLDLGYTAAQTGAKLSVAGGIYANGTVTATNFILGGWQVSTSTGGVTANAQNAYQVTTLATATNASFYPTFVSANNATNTAMFEYTTSSFFVNPSTGAVSIGAGGVFVGGVVTATSFVGSLSGTSTNANTATNVAGGTAGQLHYQTAPGTTGFINTSATQVGYATTAGFAVSFNTATLVATAVNLLNTATTQVGYATTAGFAANVLGGTAGSLVYQSSANATGMLAIGANGYVLTSNGSNPTWAALAGLSAGSATTATNVLGGTAGQLNYQSAPGVTAFAGPGTAGQILVSAGTSAPVYQNTLTLAGNTAATSTTTGALRVVGGVGIGGDIYFGGSLYQNGVLFSGSSGSGSGGTNRVVIISDGASVTINGDTTDMAVQTNTQSTGTLTINAITGTSTNGQKIMFRLQSNNVQTFSWNAIFAGSNDLGLPTASTGGAKYDYIGFIYNSTAAKWHAISRNFGF